MSSILLFRIPQEREGDYFSTLVCMIETLELIGDMSRHYSWARSSARKANLNTSRAADKGRTSFGYCYGKVLNVWDGTSCAVLGLASRLGKEADRARVAFISEPGRKHHDCYREWRLLPSLKSGDTLSNEKQNRARVERSCKDNQKTRRTCYRGIAQIGLWTPINITALATVSKISNKRSVRTSQMTSR